MIATRILIVDDHPMTVAAYVNLLSEVDFGDLPPEFLTAYTCEQAYQILKSEKDSEKIIDIALLDVSLPPFIKENINDGADIGNYIRKKMKACKIIMQTMHSEPLKIDSIANLLNPEGFISKNDINFEIFPNIFRRIMDGEIYYSPTIVKAQEELDRNNLVFDVHDNKILTLLSQGVKTVNLPDYIPLSLSAIEKRKATIKDQVLQQKGSDLELLQKVRKLGLL